MSLARAPCLISSRSGGRYRRDRVSLTPLRMSLQSQTSDHLISPLVLIAAVRRYWLLALALFLAVVATTTFVTLSKTPIYEATATILFDPSLPRPLGNQVQTVVSSEDSSYLNNKEYYRTQIWVIQSMRVATQVVRTLGLHTDPTFMDKRGKDEPPPTIDETAQALIDRLIIEQVKESRLVTIHYRDKNKERARRVLSVLVDTYVQQNLDDVFESATSAADWLRTQVATLRKDLEASEMALHDYKKTKAILSLSMDDQSNMLREEMKQLNSSLTAVRARRENISARVKALQEIDAANPSSVPAMELIDSVMLQRLRESFVAAKKQVDSLLSQGKGENHPDVRAAAAALEIAKLSLMAEVRNIQGAYERELSSLNKEAGGLEGLYKSAEKRALDLNLLEIEYNRLKRSKENNDRLFSLVVERSKESDLTKMLKVNNIRVIDRPLLPKLPISPNIPLSMAFGLAGGAILGFLGAMARHQLDSTLQVAEDIERELGQVFLGLLPQLSTTNNQRKRRRRQAEPEPDAPKPELIVHNHPSSGLAEAARAVRTNIVFMSPDKPHRALLITSPGPSDGKTTVACAIAIAMAQAGQRVALVDCDLRRPRMHRIFGITNDTGVTTALIETGAPAAHSTLVPNLHVLTSGPLPPNPAELLQSEAFGRFLDDLKKTYDRVIIDSPPIVPVTDAAVLATRLDGVVLVVRAARTKREMAKRAVRAINDVGGRMIGTILNSVDLEGIRYRYYHYSYYGRDGYHRLEPQSKAES
jgi:succinoglycan biosynthesis transport protein ExoP